MDVRAYNREAWDRCVVENDRWTRPVSAEEVAAAKRGSFEIVLTPTKPVPRDWFPDLPGMKTLCLASAGGQQAPLLAAAGAEVTVFDNSPKQLGQDRLVAERDGLHLELIEGDMADLSRFADESFGLIFHPCSNCFVPEILPVWKECFRVLKPGGVLLAGFTNPVRYIFDEEKMEGGNLDVRHALPYSDLEQCNEPHLQRVMDSGHPLAFGHTLEDQIAGQLNAGFVLTNFFEDRYADSDDDVLSRYMASFIATRALKL